MHYILKSGARVECRTPEEALALDKAVQAEELLKTGVQEPQVDAIVVAEPHATEPAEEITTKLVVVEPVVAPVTTALAVVEPQPMESIMLDDGLPMEFDVSQIEDMEDVHGLDITEGTILVHKTEPHDIVVVRRTDYLSREPRPGETRVRQHTRRFKLGVTFLGRILPTGEVVRPTGVDMNGFCYIGTDKCYVNRSFLPRTAETSWAVFGSARPALIHWVHNRDNTEFVNETNFERLRAMCVPEVIQTRSGAVLRVLSFNVPADDAPVRGTGKIVRYDCKAGYDSSKDGMLRIDAANPNRVRFDPLLDNRRYAKFLSLEPGRKLYVVYTLSDPNRNSGEWELREFDSDIYVVEDFRVRAATREDRQEFFITGQRQQVAGVH